MKLKEKLSLEYCGPDRHIADSEQENARDCYIVGFEKAREMAIELVMKYNKRDFDKLKGSTFTHDHFPTQKILFTDELKKLGEEEV